jgi:hypothetical protein
MSRIQVFAGPEDTVKGEVGAVEAAVAATGGTTNRLFDGEVSSVRLLRFSGTAAVPPCSKGNCYCIILEIEN